MNAGSTYWAIGRCPKCGQMSAATNGREAWCWRDHADTLGEACGYKWALAIKRSRPAKEEMTREGVELVSLTEKIDTASAMGRAFFQIALVFAELERALISERTKAGIAVRQSQGVRFGQPGKITDNPKRLAEARRMVEEGVENITAKEAVRRLNAADPKAKPIKSVETWNRWRRLGCPGADD